MNYLLFICSDGVPTTEKAAAMRDHMPSWIEEMDGRGVRAFGHALEPASQATTVRVRHGETIVSDGPFAESKEVVGGFDLIDCADLDEAIEIAAKHPVSWFHSIEIRPLADYQLGPTDKGTEGVDAVPDHSPSSEQITPPAPGRRRYLLFICVNGIAETDEEEAAIRQEAAQWLAAVAERGVEVYGHALKPPETASTVRVRDGETLITDGPFVETKEFIAGIHILDCTSREEAVEFAGRHPIARYHRVEVRPFASEE